MVSPVFEKTIEDPGKCLKTGVLEYLSSFFMLKYNTHSFDMKFLPSSCPESEGIPLTDIVSGIIPVGYQNLYSCCWREEIFEID
ncbi:hypothetical protein DSO57_1020396 [Entomophthora muscae]|uniref:Uncharacterized protein n=1 Tax=Entomophthora muscae TaxID=34485 RepID=A0ACC2RIB9_9FUNG|nr:hypothetical protein DSO57_1020396 [Entomophthora muscae]